MQREALKIIRLIELLRLIDFVLIAKEYIRHVIVANFLKCKRQYSCINV